MARIFITLKPQERDALRALAEREFRDPRAQAALIIREVLEKRGFLPADPVSSDMNSSLLEQIKQVRESLNRANERHDVGAMVGDLMIAISHLADVVEELVKNDAQV